MDAFLKSELSRLDLDFDQFLESLPESLRGVDVSLAAKVAFKPETIDQGWVAQFSPLTLLYPRLQAEAFGLQQDERIPSLNLVHLLLLIHAIIEDRELDEQVQLGPEDILFKKLLFSRGLSLLHSTVSIRESGMNARFQGLMDDYTESQLRKYAEVESLEISIRGRSDPIALAAGRASLGAVALLGICGLAEAPSQTVDYVFEAFDALVIALQLLDDLEDFEQDAVFGRENSILDELRKSAGHDSVIRDTGDVVDLQRRAVTEGHMAAAFVRTEQELSRARIIQEELNCPTLVKYMDELSEKAEALHRSCEHGITDLIRSALSISA